LRLSTPLDVPHLRQHQEYLALLVDPLFDLQSPEFDQPPLPIAAWRTMALLDRRVVERWEPFPQCIAVEGLECRSVLNLSRNIGHPALSPFAVLTLAHKFSDWILP
jgi:hypothetical protein